MDISSLRNCNCKPFAVCMYIIDGNAHHFESIRYIGGKYHKQQHQKFSSHSSVQVLHYIFILYSYWMLYGLPHAMVVREQQYCILSN